MQDSVEQSMRYVESLSDDCVYDHGYRCVGPSGDDFTAPGSDRDLVPGPYLKAWSVSYRDFLEIAEMTGEQKQLKHYKIGFTESETQYIILYQGLLLPMLENGEVVGTMRATYGISTKYWIDKTTLAVDKRLFLR
jgi:hypothetical protein